MSVKTFTRSFAGGEISPLLHARLDLAKNQTGLSLCKNFLVTPQGPVENRPGFEYVIRAKGNPGSVILIPFTFNDEQSFALEFGDGYIRFHAQGGTLLETGKAISGVTIASPGVFAIVGHGFAVGQWARLDGIGGPAALNGRWVIVATVPDADHVTFTDLFGNPINTTGMPAYVAGGIASRVYEIASPYVPVDLLDLHYVQSADVLTIVHEDYNPRELKRLGATNWTLTPISFVPTVASPAAPTVASGGPGGGTGIDHAYATTAIAANTLEESERSPETVGTWDLSVAGNFLDVTTAPVAGAIRYNLYKKTGGVFGFIGQSDGSAFRDFNIQPDMSKTPPEASFPFIAENPRAVSYFDQRRAFGGGGVSPQTIWMTRSGTESSMMYSIPSVDDDAITARIVARKANIVRHLVPISDLLALTSSGVWKIAASDGGAITPATFSAKPQSNVGASNVQPVVTADAVIYAQDRGSHIREVAYKWESASYSATDISVLAPHLFDFKTVHQMADSTAPHQVIWGVRNDGVLLGLTYQPEHEVKAWHWHATDGSFMSVCSIPEGDEDGVYAVIHRVVDGQTLAYIERMHTRQFAQLDDAFFVDSGLTYNGTPVETIFGLWHLEGREVAILADGGVHPRRTVVNGTITLESPCSKVHVGLPYDCDFMTLPLAMEGVPAFGQGVPKNLNKVWLSLYRSSSIKVGPSFQKLREFVQRTVADDWGQAPAPHTGIAQVTLDAQWQQDGVLCLRQSDPLPVTVRGVTVEVSVGG